MSSAFLVSELLRKKRDGLELSDTELAFLVDGFARGGIPDYQISAWLMAVFLKGMEPRETVALTRLVKNSGTELKWREMSDNFRDARFADKHSTGGVGDKVSLILAPLAACLGVKVPMMSGRGLGFTGGTVDKLQSIPDFNIFPDRKLMVRLLDEVGVCMMCQSDDLCPADRKLYSLRDVTSTVESLPLITASIVSKKWAEGVDAIVYDVKTGNGAFMQELPQARALARSLVEVSELAGIRAVGVITRMDEPLGAWVGNAVEVLESAHILRNEFGSDNHRRLAAPLAELSVLLAAEMAFRAGAQKSFAGAAVMARAALADGRAYEVFKRMLQAQGADPAWETKIARTQLTVGYRAPRPGHVAQIRSRELGLAGLKIGVGRRTAADAVDAGVGFELLVAVGDEVEKDQPLLRAHLRAPEQMESIEQELARCFTITPEVTPKPPELVIERVTA